MSRTRIKFCGITRVNDAQAAAHAGADAIGLVFAEQSPRAVSPGEARRIAAALPPFVSAVGLFVNAEADQVARLVQQVPLDLLQFHGDESPEYCASFGRPWIKAVRMHPDIDLHQQCQRFQGARGLLVDAWVPHRQGGTGETFDWSRIPGDLALPLVLAGGLSPENAHAAVTAVRPWGVDVSGGIEQRNADGSKRHGCKSVTAMEAFVRGIDSA